MEVASKEQTVVNSMGAAFVVGLDVGGLEGRQGMLFCYRASALIGVGNQNTESPLAKARLDGGFFAVTGSLLFNAMSFPIQVMDPLVLPSALKILPDELASFLVELIARGLAPDDRRPPSRSREPQGFIKEEWLGQDDAPDLEILMRTVGDSPVSEEPLPHFREGAGAIPMLERLPGQADRENGIGDEDSSPGNQVAVLGPLTSVELEEEEVSLAQNAELGARRRLPEVDLVDLRLRAQIIEPILVGDAGVDSHRYCPFLPSLRAIPQ